MKTAIPPPRKSCPNRGFGSPNFDRAIQQAAASKGGRTSHANGTAHRWTSEDAKAAGRKGGIASAAKRKKADADQASASTTG